jgi:glycosyltransferase involved in cell wall biosynthesis
MLVASQASNDATVTTIRRSTDFRSRLRRGLRQYWIDQEMRGYQRTRPNGYELFSDDRSEYTSTLTRQLPKSDILHLHWVSGAMDYGFFFRHAPQHQSIVWTLHDMNPFTGGCHYDLGCGRYLVGCGACPQLGSHNNTDLSSRIWQRKYSVFARLSPRIQFVAPSKWLASEVKQSPLLWRFPVHVIPHGVDLTEFAPRNRAHVRQLLDIPLDAKVVLFVAENLDNRRKGFSVVTEALVRCALAIPNLLLLSVGYNSPQLQCDVACRHVGPLSNDRFLSMVYSAADVFITCPLQEAFGLTTLEAMACATPVIGVRTGGIADLIRSGVNGFAIDAPDIEALSAQIVKLLSDDVRLREMASASRRIAIEEYSIELQTRRHVELYESCVQSEPHTARSPSHWLGDLPAENRRNESQLIRES